MNDTPTLPLTQPKKEIKRNQIQGLFEDTVELIVGGQGSFVNEKPVTGPDLKQLSQMPELKVGGQGTLAGFQERRTRADVYPQQRTQLEQELYQAQLQRIMQLPTEEKRVKVNELNELQSHYQGSVDNQGNVTIYHEANAERKQAENLTLQIQKEREEKLAKERAGKATSAKGAVGPTINLNTTFEDKNADKPG